MNIVITSMSSTTIQVSWDPVPEIHQNGIIIGYNVTYNQSTFLQLFPPMTMRVSADGDSVTLTGLEEYVVYSIRVRAYTSIGAGPYSPLHNIRTLEDGKYNDNILVVSNLYICIFNIMYVYVLLFAVPSGYPGSITVNPLSPNQIEVQWEPVPLIDRNGVITHYEVAFNQSTINTLPPTGFSVNDTDLSATVGPLQPFIEYTLSVRAFTSVGAGPFNPTPHVAMSDPSGMSQCMLCLCPNKMCLCITSGTLLQIIHFLCVYLPSALTCGSVLENYVILDSSIQSYPSLSLMMT